MIFVISSPFSSVLVTSFSTETKKVIYFSVFSPKQVNFLKNSTSSSFMIK